MGILTPNEFGLRTSALEASPGGWDATREGVVPSRWRGLALLTFLAFAEALIVFRQTLVAMASTWYTSRTFSHGLLVLPISLCLVWMRRKRIAALRPAPNLWGLLLLGVLEVLWLMGNIAEVKIIQEFALVAILVTLVWTFLGSEVVRALDFPLAFLIFAVPFGLGLIGPLQDVTAWFAVHALTLSGIPAILENRILAVPSGTWTVAEACSGIRYLFSSLMLGIVYASLVYRSRRRQVLFVCASILVPILANGVRAYGIVLLAYLTNNRLAAGVDHIVYGWMFFTVVELALFVVGLRWRQVPGRQEQAQEQGARTPIDPGAVNRQARTTLRLGFIAIVVAATLLGLAPQVAMRLWDRAASNEGSAGWSEPPVLASPPWQTMPAYDASWAPDLPSADTQFVQSYVSGAHRVDLYCALYSGRRGFELLNSYNRLTNPKLWTVVADKFEYQVIGDRQVRIHKSLIASGPVSRFVWTWYWVGGEFTGNPVRVKFLQAKGRLLGSPITTLVLAVGADSSLERSEGDRILRDFLSHVSFSSLYPQSARARVSLSGGVIDVP